MVCRSVGKSPAQKEPKCWKVCSIFISPGMSRGCVSGKQCSAALESSSVCQSELSVCILGRLPDALGVLLASLLCTVVSTMSLHRERFLCAECFDVVLFFQAACNSLVAFVASRESDITWWVQRLNQDQLESLRIMPCGQWDSVMFLMKNSLNHLCKLDQMEMVFSSVALWMQGAHPGLQKHFYNHCFTIQDWPSWLRSESRVEPEVTIHNSGALFLKWLSTLNISQCSHLWVPCNPIRIPAWLKKKTWRN